MTKEEWLAKYYPVPAAACGAGDEAVDHSIRKWEGIAWALENHFSIPIEVSAGTCALCHHYYKDKHLGSRCSACPLATNLGYPCDGFEGDGFEDDGFEDDMDNAGASIELPPEGPPWYAWQNRKDPYPMLNALKDIPPCQE